MTQFVRQHLMNRTIVSNTHLVEDTAQYRNIKYYSGEEFCEKHHLDIFTPRSVASDRHTKILEFVEKNNNQKNEEEEPEKEENTEKEENVENQLLPVVIFIHGGGWKRGDRAWWFDCYGNIGRSFAANNFIAVVPSYRLAPKFKHPYQPQDLARSIGWVYKNIHTFGGDRNTIFLTGHSAGAHLAALLALDRSYLQAENVPHTEVVFIYFFFLFFF